MQAEDIPTKMKPPGNKNTAYFYSFLQEIRPEKAGDTAAAEKKLRDKISSLSYNRKFS